MTILFEGWGTWADNPLSVSNPAEGYIRNQLHAKYISAEHDRWNRLAAEMLRITHGHLPMPFLPALIQLGLIDAGIPDFEQVSDILELETGWRVVCVSSDIPYEALFTLLTMRRYPAVRAMRGEESFGFHPVRDVFHDLFGQVAHLMTTERADLLQAFGRGGLRAIRYGSLEAYMRLHRHILDRGLMMGSSQMTLFGGKLLTSPIEAEFALKDPSPHRIVFDVERVMRTPCPVNDLQKTYFVMKNFQHLFINSNKDFGPIYTRMNDGRTWRPGQISPADEVISRGTQEWQGFPDATSGMEMATGLR